MGSRNTSLLVLMMGAVAGTASAQHPADRSQKSDALLKSAMARLQDARVGKVTVAGQILMPDGTPATQARLFIAVRNETRKAPEEIKIDPAGRFQHILPEGGSVGMDSLTLTAIVPGKAVLWRAYALGDKTLGALSLRLTPGSNVTGRIVDVNGKPLSDIAVTIPRLGPDLRATRGPAIEHLESPLTEFLPLPALKALYQTRTDAMGRFTLSSLPTTGQLRLKLGAKLMLAPGSTSAIDLWDQKQTDVGVVVAVTPGSLALHVTDRATHKPAAGVPVMVLPRSLTTQDFSGQPDDEDTTLARRGALVSDEKGDVALSGLAPGEYRLLLEGMERTVSVTEAHATRLDLPVRTGSFHGRIVDASGKPVPGVPITLEMSPDPLKELSGGFSFSNGRGDTQNAAVTDQNGKFAIEAFPWEATTVTLSVARGNDEARWSGPAREIGKSLEMRLTPGALVTVTGRLTDPMVSQLKSKTVSLIRWQDSPRITWLMNATAVTLGPQGRFKVDGLRRGEGFSFISNSPFSGNGEEEGEGFESPRFVTSRTTGVQNLGDVVVHPLDSGQQILQLYGIDSAQQLAHLAALRRPASESAVVAAREALARYGSAITSGDYDAVHRLTSHLSVGWSEDRREFLERSALRTPTVENAQPLRFVPGISLAYLLAFGKSGASPFNFSFGAAAADLQANPDWIVFATPGPATVRIAGIAHREQGDWKVVGLSSVFGSSLDSLFLLDASNGSPAPRAADFEKPAPVVESAQLDAARAAGEKYLAAWSHGDDATQLALTSPFASAAPVTVTDLRKARSRRIDEGICPVSDMTALHLMSVAGLTQWECEWLAQYARTVEELSGQQPAKGADKGKEFPGKYVERGDLVPFSYNVDGHDFLILMVKHAGSWQILEPAVPL